MPRIGDREIEQAALVSMQSATDLLRPLDVMTVKLTEVKPIYTATFTIADKLGDLRLTSSWQPMEDDGSAIFFNLTSQRWTRLDRDTNATTPLVDICLTDLSTSFGWALTVDTAQPVDESRIEQALISFAHSLKVDSQAALRQASDRPFVKFTHVPNAVLRSIEQRITYPFGMQDIDYTVDLTRVQNFEYPERRTGKL